MPMEGHWRRVNAPLDRRERRVVAGGAVATAVAILVLIFATAGTSRPAPGPGCVRSQIAGVMGGSELNLCGRHARDYCARAANGSDPNSTTIRTSCREAGLVD
jgi:hypothetical protein